MRKSALILLMLLLIPPELPAQLQLRGDIWSINAIDFAGNTWEGSTLQFTSQVANGSGYDVGGFFTFFGSNGSFGKRPFSGTVSASGAVSLNSGLLGPTKGLIARAIFNGQLNANRTQIVNGNWDGPGGIPSTNWVATRSVGASGQEGADFLVRRGPTLQSDMVFASKVPLNPDEAALANLKKGWADQRDLNAEIGAKVDYIPSSIVSGPREALTGFAIDRLAERAGTAGTVFKFFDTAVSIVRDRAVGAAEYFLGGLKAGLKANEMISGRIADDPPNFDFETVVVRQQNLFNFGMAQYFGLQFAPIDEAFYQWGLGLESYDLALTTMERMQGAALADNDAAFSMQANELGLLLTEGDLAFRNATERFNAMGALFNSMNLNTNPGNPLAMLTALQETTRTSGLPVDLVRQLRERGFSDLDLEALKNDIRSASVPNSFLTMADLPDVARRSTAEMEFASILQGVSQPTTTVPEPGTAILTLAGLLGCAFVARRKRA